MIDIEDYNEEQFSTIKPSHRKWPVSDPMALAYPAVNLNKVRETANSTIQEFLNNEKPAINEEKEAVMEEQKETKILKGHHQPCKNHPDKYAVKEGLCHRCYTKKYGKSPYFKEKKVDVEKVDEVKAVTVDNHNIKITTREGKPFVYPENWGKVNGVDFSMDLDGLMSKEEAIRRHKEAFEKYTGINESCSNCEHGQQENKGCALGCHDFRLYKPITAEITATKICEIWQVKDGEATAEIIFKGDEFDSCEVAGIPGHFKLEDWLFLGKVAREIERLAGVR